MPDSIHGADVQSVATSYSGDAEGSVGLRGRLGTLDIALAILAFSGPLAGTAGCITFLIAYGNGIGAPSTFLALMVVFLLLSVSFGAMSQLVPNPEPSTRTSPRGWAGRQDWARHSSPCSIMESPR
jgi:hypothetical protein